MSRGLSLSEAEYRALLARGEHSAAPRPPKPRLPSLQVRYPEERFYDQLYAVSHAHGWLVTAYWTATGEEPGLELLLVRPPELLYALVRVPERPLTPMQAKWLAAVRKTAAEVVEWGVGDVAAMTERLSRRSIQTGTPASRPSLECPSSTKGASDEQV